MKNTSREKLPFSKVAQGLVLLFLLTLSVNSLVNADKKRREPTQVTPVQWEHQQIETTLDGALFGYQQDSGIIVARDIKSGHLLWTKRVYEVRYSDDIEGDKQDIYISDLQIDKENNRLHVTNEHGQTYALDLVR